jgi:uncharacterized protein YjiS (DUF1127 family)
MSIIGKSAPAWPGSACVNGARRPPSNKGYVGSSLTAADVRARIGGVFRMISRWIDRSNQRNALSDLDDHLLRDIGISGDEALREASKPFWKS